MAKNVLIVLLVLCLGVVTHALVRVENQRYALMTGMCMTPHEALEKAEFGKQLEWVECLETAQTRTSWIWHVFYAVLNP